MNHVLIGLSRNRYSHIRLLLEALKSSDKNVIVVFLLSVLPSFCITVHNAFPVQILGKINQNFSDSCVFLFYVIVIFNLDQ